MQNIYFWVAGTQILLMKSAEFIHELVTKNDIRIAENQATR